MMLRQDERHVSRSHTEYQIHFRLKNLNSYWYHNYFVKPMIIILSRINAKNICENGKNTDFQTSTCWYTKKKRVSFFSSVDMHPDHVNNSKTNFEALGHDALKNGWWVWLLCIRLGGYPQNTVWYSTRLEKSSEREHLSNKQHLTRKICDIPITHGRRSSPIRPFWTWLSVRQGSRTELLPYLQFSGPDQPCSRNTSKDSRIQSG